MAETQTQVGFRPSANVARMQPSSTLAAMQAAMRMKAAGVDVVDLGAGEPDFDTPGHIKEAASEAMLRARIVHRHLNEVKYCYDQALVRQPKLDGRIVVKFTIAGTGQVLASFVQSTTLGSPAVEMCVANAVKRWDFPAPRQGGLAIVSYPFTFSPAGN